MTELKEAINNIVRFGLYPNLDVVNKEKVLEKHLVKFYSLYFDISFEFDGNAYPDFDKSTLPEIRKNVEANFKEFGLYRTVLDFDDLYNFEAYGIGDAIDDLTDIVYDLLEIKWRIENNSVADGLWFFQLIFNSHTQQHILDLLNYMKQKYG